MKSRPNLRSILKRSQSLKALVTVFRNLPGDLATLRWTLNRPRQIASYFNETSVRKLQVGCGKNILPGWLNCDYSPSSPQAVYLDATAPFPFEDGSFDFIFSEHMIEHVPYAGGQKMLSECYRVLKPGGKIRISTPNLRNIASLMAGDENQEKQHYIKASTDKYIPENTKYLPGFVVNNFYWDFMHYFIYDPASLTQAFESAGFGNVQQMASGSGSSPDLCNLECHAKIVGAKLDQFESMIFEARKN